MIIDCETWKQRERPTQGLPTFVSWKKLKEALVGDQPASSIELGELGLIIRVDVYAHEERGKHAWMDKQV